MAAKQALDFVVMKSRTAKASPSFLFGFDYAKVESEILAAGPTCTKCGGVYLKGHLKQHQRSIECERRELERLGYVQLRGKLRRVVRSSAAHIFLRVIRKNQVSGIVSSKKVARVYGPVWIVLAARECGLLNCKGAQQRLGGKKSLSLTRVLGSYVRDRNQCTALVAEYLMTQEVELREACAAWLRANEQAAVS